MVLETVVYPQEQYGYICKEFYGYGEQESSFLGKLERNIQYGCNNWEHSSSSNSMMQNQVKGYNNWDISHYSSLEEGCNITNIVEENNLASNPLGCRRKRRRTVNNNKKEDLEKQRMVHIAVERNRRKQMNEYLNVLRSLMPTSYVQRADQASIIGGAINFVKELEHHLQTLQSQNTLISQPKNDISSPPLFSDFFSFPQYSNRSSSSPTATENGRVMGDIEVNLVESHANLKILSKRRPKQLMKILGGLQYLCLTILHLNVTTVDQMVLYSISAKLEEGCQLTTADEIAQAVNQLLSRIQEEATSNR
ncbi:transcription factor bHLH94-like isoform X1 [Lycium barbarum]|uniref:transcription factor bHLH94-like isoform X1 n=1 Tax=Lycium barbarum TaxID=112863 RepID=UPI00293F35F5|nr:transcription factor bHLH94-like isoform X1 [Lycium barbarum]